MYNHQLLNQQTLDIKSEKKWEEEFGNINWKKVYMVPIFSSIDTKLRNFQFKFLHRIIPTNKSLFKYKLVNSNICDICNMNIDSIKHLFWECPHVQHFWNELKNYLNELNIDINLNYKLVSLGLIDSTSNINVKNFIFILAKYFIFCNKCNKCIPKFVAFKQYLYRYIDIERNIAFEKEKLATHNLKWSVMFS